MATLPINVSIGPIGTFVALYLLQIDGAQAGTVYVAIAAAAFNAVSIPAAIIWGYATDLLHRRKALILVGYSMTTIFLFSFFFTTDTSAIILVYSAVSLFSSASATPLNLLIIESEPKNRWASGFARLSFIASVGATVGYVFSSIWVQYLPVTILVIPFSLLSLSSVILAIILVKEPPIGFEREVVVMQKQSFFQRVQAIPLVFLNIPRISDFRRTFRGLRNELTNYLPLLYLTIVLFYLASGMFNTSLVPALSAHLLSDSDVYAVNVAALVIQILTFRYAGKYLANKSLAAAASQSLTLRGGAYVLLGVFSLLIPGALFLIPSLILFALSSGFAYGIYYTASNTMIFNSIRGQNQGSSLGVYSAVVGFSTTIGSLLSGFTSRYLGFHTTFIAAGVLLVIAAAMTARLKQSAPEQDVKGEPATPV